MPTRTPPIPLVRCSPEHAALAVAGKIAKLIRERAAAGRKLVLGLASGRTPLLLYDELARLHREEGLSFANVVTFNLDEYLGLPAGHPRTFRNFMRAKLFERVDIAPANAYLPASDLSDAQLERHCRNYERTIADAGGIDLQVLGLGRNGHIGFNEPGSTRESRTRVVELAAQTREDAAAAFGGLEHVPERAITMGVATILAARRIRVLAFGEEKREVLRRAVGGDFDPEVPAAFLRGHRNVLLYTDLLGSDQDQ